MHVKKETRFSEVADSHTITKEDWEKVTKAYDVKSLYGLGAKYKAELMMAVKELEEEHDREAKKDC